MVVVVAAFALAACGDSTESSPAAEPDGAVTAGGVLTVASQPPANLDPHFASLAPEELINHQIYNWLVILDGQNNPIPDLATEWEMSEDGRTWTFTIRDNVQFSDGTPLTSEDVKASFDRMRDPDVGAPTASVYGDVESIEAPDPTTVVFNLSNANPEFVKDTADYHAAIIPKTNTQPGEEWIGSGPFMVERYAAEDRMVLVKNPNYWGTDADGNQLPYLDGVTFIFSPDEGSQVAALQGGQAQFVAGLTAELAAQIEADAALKVLNTPSNFHLLIRIRSDREPGNSVELRQALKMGTDIQGLIDIVRPGYATVGNLTPVGEVYGDYYLDQAPSYDPDRATELLAEAGYADGFEMTLYAMQYGDVNAFATAWKEQMAQIGVTVNIESIPADVYYSDGDASWMEVDFGITNWADRPTPVAYYNLAYVTDGLYNESHWSDPEFDQLTTQINSELDAATRTDLYHQSQQILIDRGPVIVLGHQNALAGQSADIDGIELAIDWAKTLFVTAHYTE
jgi:peptide/nickel transport system substrate-binding protein